MVRDLSKIFHESSKSHRAGKTRFPKSEAEWPAEWKTVYYKTYPRFPKIPLPDSPAKADFFELVRKRASSREFGGGAIPLQALGTILKYSCGITQETPERNPRRANPSGGGRFPLEIYPLIFKGSDELASGLYHYNIREHALDVLWERPFSSEDIGTLFTYEWARGAAMMLVMTAVFERNRAKYGERGYRYVLVEAGHIGQNVYLCSHALGLLCCALVGMRDTNLEHLIDIDGVTESVVYSIALGCQQGDALPPASLLQ